MKVTIFYKVTVYFNGKLINIYEHMYQLKVCCSEYSLPIINVTNEKPTSYKDHLYSKVVWPYSLSVYPPPPIAVAVFLT